MIALILLATVACASAASVDSCTVGSWSEWSECTSSKHCSKIPPPVFSYAMEATTEWDQGRSAMQTIMERKTAAWKAREECVAAKTCPEFMMMPDYGSATCDALGMAGDIPCKNVDKLSFLSFADMGYTTPIPGDNKPAGNDVWGWIDPLNGDEYAMMGITGGTSFVRITDPVNPVPCGFIYSATGPSTWRDIKVIGNYAYIVSEASNHGLQVFDLTRLRGVNSVQYFTPDAVNNDFGQAHNIVSNSDTNFVYVVGSRSGNYPRICAGGLHAIDVSNPLQPRTAGCFGGDGYVHDAQCEIYHGPDARYYGREICVCFNEDTLTMVDVHDKTAMRMIGKTGYVNAAYTHQGWMTEDHKLVLLDDEQDEQGKPSNQQFTKTYVWDIQDLENPVLKSVFESSERSIDHNQYIIGDLSYQANYESGLRILHIDRATDTLENVGYFDVLPARTTANFAGTWSVFPYYPSGVVAVTSIDFGLYLAKPNMAAIKQQIESRQPYAEQSRTRSIVSVTEGSSCPPLVETRTCVAATQC